MTLQPSVRNLWNAARSGLARLNRRLAESGDAEDLIFQAPDAKDLRRRYGDLTPSAQKISSVVERNLR
jgi:hypothetical protein